MPDEDGNILVTLHFETLYIVYHMIQCAANSATTVLSDVYVVHSSRGNMTIIIYLLYIILFITKYYNDNYVIKMCRMLAVFFTLLIVQGS